MNAGPQSEALYTLFSQRKKKQQHKSQQYSAFVDHLDFHAAPLISINHRDVKTLDELFLRHDIAEVLDDVNVALRKFLPAPCWEDDPFELAKRLLEA